MNFKRIGVLGGMGPAASAEFYQRLISKCQSSYGSVQDSDFPHIILNSLPLIQFDESGILCMDSVLSQLINEINILESAKCELAVIPCNTVHVLYHSLVNSTIIPIINMIDELANNLELMKINNAVILCSKFSRESNLFFILGEKNISYRYPTAELQSHIDQIIRILMSGELEEGKKQLDKVIHKLNKKTKESIVFGCTELSLISPSFQFEEGVIDIMDIAVDTTLDRATYI